MIIYNTTWLTNLRLQSAVKKGMERGYITADEFKAITAKYPVGFYSPNIFIRVGLFILTCIIVSFADGLLSMVFASSGMIESFGWFIFLGLISYLALELVVKTNNHYRSGVDDALLFISGCLLITGLTFMLSHWGDGIHYFPLSALIFLLCLYFTLRLADMLAAIVCCLSLLAFVFFGWTRLIVSGLTTVPFIMMLASAGMYGLSAFSVKKEALINYDNCLVIAQVTGLVALYASGNYYIIQTLSTELMGKTGPVPFGMIFWIWTILLPFVYIAFGIKSKDVILLRTGLLLIAAAVLTFRCYYHLLPVDIMLTIAGALVLGIVYAITKYLKTPKHGFTVEETDDGHLMDNLKIESLIIAETFSHTPSAPADQGTRFGGGDFGGGGSSGGF